MEAHLSITGCASEAATRCRTMCGKKKVESVEKDSHCHLLASCRCMILTCLANPLFNTMRTERKSIGTSSIKPPIFRPVRIISGNNVPSLRIPKVRHFTWRQKNPLLERFQRGELCRTKRGWLQTLRDTSCGRIGYMACTICHNDIPRRHLQSLHNRL